MKFGFLINSAREHQRKIIIVKRWYVFCIFFCCLLGIRFTGEYFSTVFFIIRQQEWEQVVYQSFDRFYMLKLWVWLQRQSYQHPERHQESGPGRMRHLNLKFAVCLGEESKVTKGTMDFRICSYLHFLSTPTPIIFNSKVKPPVRGNSHRKSEGKKKEATRWCTEVEVGLEGFLVHFCLLGRIVLFVKFLIYYQVQYFSIYRLQTIGEPWNPSLSGVRARLF